MQVILHVLGWLGGAAFLTALVVLTGYLLGFGARHRGRDW